MTDPNRTVRYTIIQYKKYYRDHAKEHLSSLWIAMVDTVNALARSVLGLVIVFSSLIADLSKKGQQKWYRKPEVKSGN